MRWHDISLEVNSGMVVWPGDPQVEIDRVQKIEAGAVANVSKIAMSLHTGTHIDAPYHFLDTGTRMDGIPLDALIGETSVIEISPSIKQITAGVLLSLDPAWFTERVLFKTRNSINQLAGAQRFDPDFVALDVEAARLLVDKGIRLVGIDAMSIAPFRSAVPTHRELLSHSVVILEGLHLQGIPAGRYQLVCLPLKLGDAEGAPARAILIEPD